MRFPLADAAEKGRVTGPRDPFASAFGEREGMFYLRSPAASRPTLRVIFGGEPAGWDAAGYPPPFFEHASVVVVGEVRCPTWEEMAFVKATFWADDECVVQYHPPAAVRVNFHPTCLHLFRPVGVALPLPPAAAVGPTGVPQ
jgi:hypothetical protein